VRYLTLLNTSRCWEAEREHYGVNGGDSEGMFEFGSLVDGEILKVIASRGEGWEHVSVSRMDRCPTWEEMEQIAKLFFADHEEAVQFHVPTSDHVNVHNFCLHWWRPTDAKLPRPPNWMVG